MWMILKTIKVVSVDCPWTNTRVIRLVTLFHSRRQQENLLHYVNGTKNYQIGIIADCPCTKTRVIRLVIIFHSWRQVKLLHYVNGTKNYHSCFIVDCPWTNTRVIRLVIIFLWKRQHENLLHYVNATIKLSKLYHSRMSLNKHKSN